MTSFKIDKTNHNDIKKQEKIRLASKTFSNDNEAKVAKSKLRPSAAVSLPLNNEYQPTLTELVLGEEICGKGMYWCNTNKKCKPLPKGFDNLKKKTKESFNENHKAIVSGREKDEEGYMANTEMDTIDSAVKKLRKIIKKGDTQLPAWVQSKITKAADYIDTAADYLDSNEMSEESDVKGKGSGTKDACYTKVKSRYNVWPSAYASGAIVKCRKVGASNWGNKSEEVEISIVQKILGEEICGKGMYWCNTNKECKPLPKGFDVPGQKMKPTEVGIGKPVEGSCSKTKKGKDCPVHGMDDCLMVVDEACWTGFKKVGMKKKGKKMVPNCVPEEVTLDEVTSESIKIEDVFGNTFVEFIDLITPKDVIDEKKGFWDNIRAHRKNEEYVNEAIRLPAEFGNLIAAIVMWRGITKQITLFFPQAKMPSKKDVQREVQKIYPGGKVISFAITYITSNYSSIDSPIVRVGYYGGNLGKPAPNKNYTKPMSEEVEIEEDWQKENRKDKTDGLSQKAVNAYRRENPGSNLQTAVTEKKPTGKRAKRKSNFCRRMKGMKSKLTSAKTARDPDSRINKALNRWNCN